LDPGEPRRVGEDAATRASPEHTDPAARFGRVIRSGLDPARREGPITGSALSFFQSGNDGPEGPPQSRIRIRFAAT